MSTYIICDQCGNEITDNARAQIGIIEEGEWEFMDVHVPDCALRALGVHPDNRIEADLNELEEAEIDHYQDALPFENETPRTRLVLKPKKELTNEDRLENEKKFRKEAEELTAQITGVSARGLRP